MGGGERKVRHHRAAVEEEMCRNRQRYLCGGQERRPCGDMDFKDSWRECGQKFLMLQKILVKRDPNSAVLNWQGEVISDLWESSSTGMARAPPSGEYWEVWKWRLWEQICLSRDLAVHREVQGGMWRKGARLLVLEGRLKPCLDEKGKIHQCGKNKNTRKKDEISGGSRRCLVEVHLFLRVREKSLEKDGRQAVGSHKCLPLLPLWNNKQHRLQS